MIKNKNLKFQNKTAQIASLGFTYFSFQSEYIFRLFMNEKTAFKRNEKKKQSTHTYTQTIAIILLKNIQYNRNRKKKTKELKRK